MGPNETSCTDDFVMVKIIPQFGTSKTIATTKEKLMSMDFAKALFNDNNFWLNLPMVNGVPVWTIKGYPVLTNADCKYAGHYLIDCIDFNSDNVFFYYRWSRYFQDKVCEERSVD